MATFKSAFAQFMPAEVMDAISQDRNVMPWQGRVEKAVPGHLLLVADALDSRSRGSRQIVGLGDCGPGRHRCEGYDGEIYALYVHPDWQGAGIGRRLLTTLLSHLARSNFRGAYAYVLAQSDATGFYEIMGGRRIGFRVSTYASVRLREIAFGWSDLGNFDSAA